MKRHAHPARPLALAFILVFAAAGALGAQTGELSQITSQRDGDRLAVEVLVGGNFIPEVSSLNFPRRLVLDFTPVDRISAAPYTQIDDAGVLAIRTGQFKTLTARVVFDLADRAPAYSVSPIPNGVRVTFWLEEGTEAISQPPVRGEVKPPAPTPTKVRETPGPETEKPSGPRRTDFFAGARLGGALLLNRELLSESGFSLYGETANVTESYALSSSPAFDFTLGKYFNNIKVGAGVTFWSLKQDALYTASIPHPFEAGTPRSVDFGAGIVKNSMLNIYGYGEFAFYQSETFSVWAGLLAGLCKGTFLTLDDFNLTENAPFNASDVVISDITSIEDTYSELMFGGLLTLEYRFHPRVSLILDAKMIYANPKILNLGLRANFLQIQPVIGLQVNF